MTASTPTERKRPGDELIITEPKKVPRLGTSPETTTIHNPQMLASDPATKQSDARITPPVQPVVTNPGSSLLIEKDQLIEHLQLELARANDELAKTQNKLLDTEYKLSEALKQIPKPPDATDVYKTGVEKVKITHQTLLDKVYANGQNSDAITTDTFAQAAVRHLSIVQQLEMMQDGLIPALDLMMRLANTCWCDPDMTMKMSGYGDSEEAFFELDAQLVGMIDKGYGEMSKQSAASAATWVAATEKYLKRTRDHLAGFGVDGYFPQSIAKLETMI